MGRCGIPGVNGPFILTMLNISSGNLTTGSEVDTDEFTLKERSEVLCGLNMHLVQHPKM